MWTYSQAIEYLTDQGHDLVEISKYVLPTTSLETLTSGLKAYANSLFVATSGSMWGLTAVMCVVPVVLFVIALIVIRKKYIIDEAMYDKILKEISERNAKSEA